MKWTREHFIPKDARKIEDPDSSAVAYLTEKTNQTGKLIPYMVAFQGKAQKPALNYRYRSDEHRDKHMREFFESVQYRENARKERAAKRKTAALGLDVGDVLKASWGYEQTNIDYYEVVGIKGKRSVVLRPIAAHSTETGWLRGESVPVPGKYIGEPFTKQAREGTVKFESYKYGFKLEPQAVVDGVRLYPASHHSSYA